MSKYVALARVAAHSLYRQKLRSFLSILGIVCGVLAVMAMISTGEGAKRKVLAELETLGLRNIYIEQVELTQQQRESVLEEQSHGLTWYDVSRLSSQSGYIDQISGFLSVNQIPVGIRRNIVPEVVYVSPDFIRLAGLHVKSGRFFSQDDFDSNRLVCVLGAGVAKKLGGAGELGQLIRLEDKLYKIVGILVDTKTSSERGKEISHQNPDDMIFLSFTKDITGGKYASVDSKLDQIIIKIKEGVDVLDASKAISRTMQLNHNNVLDYSLIVPLELLNKRMKTQSIFNLVLTVVAGISLMVGGIGIMNIMLANVSERKREIGLRRAVGATHIDITIQFLFESVILTMIGGIAGLLLGFVAVFAIESVAGWPVKVTLISVVLPFLLAVGCGLVFGLHPAVKASRLEPIQALRSF